MTAPDIELDLRAVAQTRRARRLAHGLRGLADQLEAFPNTINGHANVNILTHCNTIDEWDERIRNAIPNPFEYIEDAHDPYYRARWWNDDHVVSITLTIRRELLEDAGRLTRRQER